MRTPHLPVPDEQKESEPETEHKERFKKVAKMWATAPEVRFLFFSLVSLNKAGRLTTLASPSPFLPYRTPRTRPKTLITPPLSSSTSPLHPPPIP